MKKSLFNSIGFLTALTIGLSGCGKNLTIQNEDVCNKTKNADSCYIAANGYQQAIDVKKDKQKALQLYLQGCDLHHYQSCLGAFSIYASIFNDNNELEKAEKFLVEHKQDSQIDNVNYQIGRAYLSINDFKRASEFFDKSCNENVVNACKDNAGLYSNTHKVHYSLDSNLKRNRDTTIEKDTTIMNSYLMKACELKDTYSCNALGKYYKYEKNHLQTAMIFWDKSCNLGDCYYKDNEIKLQKAEELKVQEEQLKIQKIKALRERKGQHIMTFVDSYSYRDYRYQTFAGRWVYISEEDSKNECMNSCSSKEIIGENGYNSLQEALNDNWKLIGQVSSLDVRINENCICKNISKFVLEK